MILIMKHYLGTLQVLEHNQIGLRYSMVIDTTKKNINKFKK